MPDSVECEGISNSFEQKCNIPQLIGAVDGTHIPILPPSDGYRDFINRKGWPSLILQAVVDDKYRFRNINCQAPGSCHDAAVFRESLLYREHERLIPRALRTINEVDIPYMIVGDPAYPLLPWLLKAYTKSARLSPEEESFNVYLNRGRVCVEIAFGRLKSRWRCLLKWLDIHYTFVPSVVSACCILHNIVESKSEKYTAAWETAVQQAELLFPQPAIMHNRELNNYTADRIRNTLMEYLSNNFELRRAFY